MNSKLEGLQTRITTCNKCERLRSVTPWPLAHICFSDSPKVMTIGRNPGLEYPYSHISLEELSKFYHDHWLISKYGKYLLKVFGEDFVKEQIFACNLCKCSTPKNAVLMDCEIKHCRPYLDEQISIVKPKIILIFGTEVANEYVGKGNWEYLQKISINNMTVFVCRHPAYFTYKHDPKSDLQDKEQTRVLRTIKEFVCQL